MRLCVCPLFASKLIELQLTNLTRNYQQWRGEIFFVLTTITQAAEVLW